MRLKMFRIIFCVMFLFLLPSFGNFDVFYFHRPADTSTTEEQKIIQYNLEHIAIMAKEFGSTQKFNSIPVVVSDSGFNGTPFWGYCGLYGDGRYIALKREIFSYPNKNLIFAVLLHEIGHCYFNREHSFDLIKRNGLAIKWTFTKPQADPFYFRGMPASIMYFDDLGSNDKQFTSPNVLTFVKSLQKYYVRELILGKRPELNVLNKLKQISWLKIEEVPQTP